jgi:hypothetical protein
MGTVSACQAFELMSDFTGPWRARQWLRRTFGAEGGNKKLQSTRR